MQREEEDRRGEKRNGNVDKERSHRLHNVRRDKEFHVSELSRVWKVVCTVTGLCWQSALMLQFSPVCNDLS